MLSTDEEAVCLKWHSVSCFTENTILIFLHWGTTQDNFSFSVDSCQNCHSELILMRNMNTLHIFMKTMVNNPLIKPTIHLHFPLSPSQAFKLSMELPDPREVSIKYKGCILIICRLLASFLLKSFEQTIQENLVAPHVEVSCLRLVLVLENIAPHILQDSFSTELGILVHFLEVKSFHFPPALCFIWLLFSRT